MVSWICINKTFLYGCVLNSCALYLFACEFDYVMAGVWEWNSLSASVYVCLWRPPRAVVIHLFVCICEVVWMTWAEEVTSQRSERQREQEWRVGKDAVLSRMLHKQIILCKSFFCPKGGQTNAFALVYMLAPSTILTFCPSAPTHPPVPRIHLHVLVLGSS